MGLSCMRPGLFAPPVYHKGLAILHANLPVTAPALAVHLMANSEATRLRLPLLTAHVSAIAVVHAAGTTWECLKMTPVWSFYREPRNPHTIPL